MPSPLIDLEDRHMADSADDKEDKEDGGDGNIGMDGGNAAEGGTLRRIGRSMLWGHCLDIRVSIRITEGDS